MGAIRLSLLSVGSYHGVNAMRPREEIAQFL